MQKREKATSESESDHERQLQFLNSVGDYREAIRLQIALDSPKRGDSSIDAARREVQFAVAMQHAGFYSLSYDAYQAALDLAIKGTGLNHTFQSRVMIQIAVLDERLGRSERAWHTLNGVKIPDSSKNVGIAKMTDADWYFLTYMKLCFRRKDFSLAKQHLAKHRPHTRHSADWGRLFETVLIARKRQGFNEDDLIEIDNISSNYRQYDPPGEPWIGLFAGPWVAKFDLPSAVRILQNASAGAERMGKFFLVAAIHQELAQCLRRMPGREEDARLAFTRSLNAYGRCHLIMQRPIRSRIAKIGHGLGIDAADVGDFALRSSSLLFDRSQIKFSLMCRLRSNAHEVKPYEAFEHFIEEWAPFRFAGTILKMPPGETAADVLLVREMNGRRFGTAIQAKHYSRPKESVPNRNPRLRELGAKYGLTVDRYVFVVSTSAENGWDDRMWNSQTSEKLRNIIADLSVEVQVMTEPELQTDVVLNDYLLRMFFDHVIRSR